MVADDDGIRPFATMIYFNLCEIVQWVCVRHAGKEASRFKWHELGAVRLFIKIDLISGESMGFVLRRLRRICSC